MKRVILDTNFLIDLARFKIGLEEVGKLLDERHEILTISSVIGELEKMNSKNAKIALKLIEMEKINVLKTEERSADKAILNLADRNTIVATNDIELRKKLKKLGIKTIYLRAKKTLEMG